MMLSQTLSTHFFGLTLYGGLAIMINATLKCVLRTVEHKNSNLVKFTNHLQTWNHFQYVELTLWS